MGVVWRALDPRLGREVALKTITGFVDVEATERFVREARAVARVNHPGIVQVYDAGAHGGVSFVALELVDGGSLAKRLETGPLAPNDAAALVRDLALAVAAAHGEGIVHRDLKPANVLLDSRGREPGVVGRPRLTDFGLARDAGSADLTETGVALGTPAYMAPEQANADKAAIGPRTDVYGLGAVLYHAVTGSAPFQGGTPLAIMSKVVHEEVESPSRRRAARGLPPLARDLETIVTKALEKGPGSRYDSAAALSKDLAHYVAGEPIAARPLSRLARAGRWLRRNRALTLATAATLAVAAAVVLVQARAARNADRRRVASARDAAVAAIGSFDEARRLPTPRTLTLEGMPHRTELVARAAGALVFGHAYFSVAPEEGRELWLRVGNEVFDLGLEIREPELAGFACALMDDPPERRALVERARNDWNARQRLVLVAVDAAERAGRDRDQGAARAAIRSALDRDPDSGIALSFAVRLEQEAGDVDAAIRAADHLVAIDPAFATGWILRAQCHEAQRKFALAEADYGRAIEIEPTNLRCLFSRATVRFELGNFDGAVSDAQRILQRDPGEARVHFMLGAVRAKQQRYEESVPSLLRALELDPKLFRAHGLLGEVYEESGRLEDARTQYRKVLEGAAPGSADVAGARASLKRLEGR
jgi:serine/threonine-protein kinase